MKVDWNKNQELAILARNGTVLVSAAAGSGKSAVLVQRVIDRLCDEVNVCPADTLMIVTFTNAAAAGLRHKINKELYDLIKKNPDNEHLARQQRLLSSAVIGTMDSFCGNLVRENFFLSDIDPDFRILDSSEEAILVQKAADNVLEKYYSEMPDGFVDLLELFGSDKSDAALIKNIRESYYYSTAYPFPEKWIDTFISDYTGEIPARDTKNGKAILSYIEIVIDDCIEALEKAKDLCIGSDILEQKYIPEMEDKLDLCRSLKELCLNAGWDEIYHALSSSGDRFKSMPPISSKKCDCPLEKEMASSLRNGVKTKLGRLPKEMLKIEQEYKDDCAALLPPLRCFANIVKEFSRELYALKKEENAYSFSDISHAALRLLVNEDRSKTPLAKEISGRFTEILIDEYQDTNEAQDLLFNAVSKDQKNMFIVGDVKQSIYRFRNAMPEIFIDRRNKYRMYDKDEDNYPSKIFLDSNYRSRKEIINTVNFFFKKIMTKNTGEMDYDENEYLNYEAGYNDADVPCEIHLLKFNEAGERIHEAEHIASEIKKLIDSHFQVKDGRDTYRDIRYSDICILLRAVKGIGPEYANILRKNGIPASCEADESFCSKVEVATVLSLLKAINNPLDDLSLLSVLYSPIYSFTPDELAGIRLASDSNHLYSALKAYANDNEKAKRVLEELSAFRKLSVIYSTDEMLRRIYEQTGYDEIVRAMPEGEKRAENLAHLLDYAEIFDLRGNFGLSDFIRFVDRVTSSGGDLSVNSASSGEGNCVNIMTIHKSKGLEFPVVFIAKCNREGKEENKTYSDVLLNSRTLLGVKRQDRELLRRYLTLQFSGTKLQNKLDGISEELRVLYVAMTRAKEKLYFVLSDSKKTTMMLNPATLKSTLFAAGKPQPSDIINMNNFAKWILSVALTASGCSNMANESGIISPHVEKADYVIYKSFTKELAQSQEETAPEQEAEEEKIKPDEETVRKIAQRIDFRYSYLPLTTVAAKRTASGLNEQKINDKYFASERPAFMNKDAFTPAQKGTFTHLFMEKCDFILAGEDVEKELERLVSLGVFTPEQAKAVNVDALKNFFESELFERMKNAGEIYREKQFTVGIDASFFEQNVTGEQVVVQGKIDCFFIENGEAVIVDYKTDFVTDASELSERYLMQMQVYKNAVEQFTEKKVKEVLLYSFKLGETVRCI